MSSRIDLIKIDLAGIVSTASGAGLPQFQHIHVGEVSRRITPHAGTVLQLMFVRIVGTSVFHLYFCGKNSVLAVLNSSPFLTVRRSPDCQMEPRLLRAELERVNGSQPTQTAAPYELGVLHENPLLKIGLDVVRPDGEGGAFPHTEIIDLHG